MVNYCMYVCGFLCILLISKYVMDIYFCSHFCQEHTKIVFVKYQEENEWFILNTVRSLILLYFKILCNHTIQIVQMKLKWKSIYQNTDKHDCFITLILPPIILKNILFVLY